VRVSSVNSGSSKLMTLATISERFKRGSDKTESHFFTTTVKVDHTRGVNRRRGSRSLTPTAPETTCNAWGTISRQHKIINRGRWQNNRLAGEFKQRQLSLGEPAVGGYEHEGQGKERGGAGALLELVRR